MNSRFLCISPKVEGFSGVLGGAVGGGRGGGVGGLRWSGQETRSTEGVWLKNIDQEEGETDKEEDS